MAKITGTYDNQQVNIDGAATEETLYDLVDSIHRLTGIKTQSLRTGTILLRRGPSEDRMPFVPLKGEIVYDTDLEQVFVGNSTAYGGKSVFGNKILVDTNTGNLTTTSEFRLGRSDSTDTVKFQGTVDSDILPSVDAAKNLGSPDNRWQNVHAASFTVGSSVFGETGLTTDSATFQNLTVESRLDLNSKLYVDNNVFVNTVTGSSIGLGTSTLNNAVGDNNIAIGNKSLRSVSGGSNNTALGRNAGTDLQSGDNNLVLGSNAGVSAVDASNEVVLGNTDIRKLRIPGLGINYTPTGSFKTPAGTSEERADAATGAIRFNTDKTIFEGYNGSNWSTLGSVSDSDQDTKINTEKSVGSDEDTLEFVAGGTKAASISATNFDIAETTVVKIKSTQATSGIDTGALSVAGGVAVAGDLIVSGRIVNSGIEKADSQARQGVTAENTQTNTVTSLGDTSIYKIGDAVRIFGASLDQTSETDSGLGLSAARVGFTEPQTGDSTIEFQYRVAQFDFDTGKVSVARSPVSVSIKDDELVLFNNTNNINLTISRNSANKGILVYRKIGNQSSFRLITVLGAKTLGNSTANLPWADYYTFDLADWTAKDATNSYDANSGLIHFPLNPPESPQYGWVDTVVSGINTASSIEVEDSFYAGTTVDVYNDDTKTVQERIDVNVSANVNSLTLDGRRYFISQLVIPENFSLSGEGEQTELIKLPWSTTTNTNSNEMITTDSANPGNNVIRSMLLNGNSLNQYLSNDESEGSESLNYTITVFGESLTLDNITITDVIGGGVNLFNEGTTTSKVYFSQNKILNGTNTLRYNYSPLLATEAEDIIIIQNNFSNFSTSVDVSAIRRGVVATNIVKNCGTGIYAFGTISTVLNPNVLVGPSGEYLGSPDTLNSEYDSVNVTLEPSVDFTSPVITYQESGEQFDLTANQGTQTGLINELLKVNGVETIGDDYSETTSGTQYIAIDNSVNQEQGEVKWKITSTLVDDLLSRASYDQLYNANTNSLGLIYRIVQTEYVPQTTIEGNCSDQGSNIYRVPVLDADYFNENDVVRLVDHNSTPSVADIDGTIVNINRVTNQIDVDLGITVSTPGNKGTVALKNNFVIVKGKIN